MTKKSGLVFSYGQDTPHQVSHKLDRDITLIEQQLDQLFVAAGLTASSEKFKSKKGEPIGRKIEFRWWVSSYLSCRAPRDSFPIILEPQREDDEKRSLLRLRFRTSYQQGYRPVVVLLPLHQLCGRTLSWEVIHTMIDEALPEVNYDLWAQRHKVRPRISLTSSFAV